MGSIVSYLREPRIASVNTGWYEFRDTDRAIVFIHGVMSDSTACWLRPASDGQPSVYWPDLLAKDPEFRQYAIYLGGYFTALNAREYGVGECANNVFAALGRSEQVHKPVLDYKSIIFVCHSTGGIVARYMLTEHAQAFAAKRVGLVLIASPSYGSRWASLRPVRLLARVYRHEVAKELAWASPILRDLDGRFRTLLDEETIPNLDGIEAAENHFVLRRKYLPPLDVVVSRESAGRYFGRVRVLENTDHGTSVKPDNRQHPAYTLLRDFRARFEKKFLDSARSFGLPNVTHSPEGHYAARELTWDAEIDLDGDAYNEISLNGVVLLERQKENLVQLPRAEVQSGQLDPYVLVPGPGTSKDVTLDPSPNGVRALTLRVKFANRPTTLHPACFCLRNYDLNAFSMDTAEFRTKPNFRADATDFAEKYIEEEIDSFVFTVRLPAEMRIAQEPWFEVYKYVNGDPRRHDGLTAALKPNFHYSGLLRVATLHVPHPAAPYSYRISWQLADPEVVPETQDANYLRFRSLTFAERMMEAREYFLKGTGTPGATELPEVIATVLTSFGQFVRKLVLDKRPKAAVDPAALSISLMILDAKSNRLVVAAGNIDDKEFTLGIGDGNAGRAWKRRTARVYDKAIVDPKRNVYFPHAVRPPHEILFSLPLLDPESPNTILAVLNVGTYKEAEAYLLRELKSREAVEQLTSKAQAYVIERLMAHILR